MTWAWTVCGPPGAVRLDEQGRLYVADTYNGRVLAFDPPFESGMAASFLFGSDFVNPTSLATDLDGTVFG